MSSPVRIALSWSSGKDCAWTLHVLRRQGAEVVALVTTFNERVDRVAMHGVRRTLVEQQADSVGLPLWSVPLPYPCDNDDYETRMRTLIARARDAGVTHMAFGDLHLADVRAYRERMLADTGIEPLFPLWGTEADTPRLAHDMLAGGLEAVITCVDPAQLDASFLGRSFDQALLDDLPPGVDPCAERGEFHTCCLNAPGFRHPIEVRVGARVERDGFWFADMVPASGSFAP